MNTCDMIKRNESDVGDIVFEILYIIQINICQFGVFELCLYGGYNPQCELCLLFLAFNPRFVSQKDEWSRLPGGLKK